jgi:hypothetical protein
MDALFKSFWVQLEKGQPANFRSFTKQIQTAEHLKLFLDSILGVYFYIHPILLATRPPYMPKHGPQYSPSHPVWISLFDNIFTNGSNYQIITLTDAEIDSIVESIKDLPDFMSAWPAIRARWQSEREQLWEIRRHYFMTNYAREIIAEAIHPRRVERILEMGGFEALENTFGY